ncbi:hypothetical protein KGQ64_13455 [bacterium]|nr:hypothetical protein [bacterium]
MPIFGRAGSRLARRLRGLARPRAWTGNPELAHLRDIDVFVWCGGKCGGSTLRATFEATGRKVLHTHGPFHFAKEVVRRDDVDLFEVFDFNASNKSRLLVVDSYRLPIERKISSFFQNLETHVPGHRSLSLDELTAVFDERFLEILEVHHPIDRIMRHRGVPSFDSFDFERGYVLARDGGVEFLKLRFADVADWGRILSSVVGRPVATRDANRTESKPVNELYRRFLANYRLPRGFLERHVEGDRHFRIHTTEEEREAYLRQWRARTR